MIVMRGYDHEFTTVLDKVRVATIENITTHLEALKDAGYRDGLDVNGFFTLNEGKYFLDGQEVDHDGLMIYLSDASVGNLVKIAIRVVNEVDAVIGGYAEVACDQE